ncbi:hypothetical protein [Vulcanisaeta souniana]|uniref:Uncharacterized protein n=1 Tax=Vulcanisaeta souniana JCM 11219 TaxID=1293586 RepID=A0A830E111_9CREN|nr:hypothetical protein [Vulcanisaeta souniana]BDR92511.1 hypothetical protein Vsou_16040 [Vulcanisaeta souniana JCM 11219]GGI76077.1 hypothetical protein GCM10007112_11130 [Vulcanisaeta souniana JCM 11219]
MNSFTDESLALWIVPDYQGGTSLPVCMGIMVITKTNNYVIYTCRDQEIIASRMLWIVNVVPILGTEAQKPPGL